MRIDRNTAFGLLAILLWSVSVAFARSISESIGPLTAGALVYLLAGSFATGHLFLRHDAIRNLRLLSPAYLFGCGTLFLIYTAALFLGLGLAANRYQTLEVGLLNYLWPALTVLLSLVILGKKATLWLIPGTIAALVGVILVLTQEVALSWDSICRNIAGNPAAYGFGLVAAIMWGLYSNLSRRWTKPDGVGAVPLFMIVTGFAFELARLMRPETGVLSLHVAIEVAFFALATGLGYIFWDVAMRKGDIVFVAACSYLTPLFSTVVGCLYLGVTPGIKLWIGCLLIIGGSVLSWRSISPQSRGCST